MRATSGSLLCLRLQLNASALLPDERNGAAQEGLLHLMSITAPYSKEGRPFTEAALCGERSRLRCYRDVMEGRGDGFTRLNLGRSIDESCKCSQHFRVGIRVVSFCIGFVLPQTDCSRIQAAGIRQCNFVLKALLLAK